MCLHEIISRAISVQLAVKKRTPGCFLFLSSRFETRDLRAQRAIYGHSIDPLMGYTESERICLTIFRELVQLASLADMGVSLQGIKKLLFVVGLLCNLLIYSFVGRWVCELYCCVVMLVFTLFTVGLSGVELGRCCVSISVIPCI